MGDRIGVQLQVLEIYFSLTNSGQLSLAYPHTGQRAVMPCNWE